MKEKIHLASSVLGILAAIAGIVTFIDSPTWTKIFGHKEKPVSNAADYRPPNEIDNVKKKDTAYVIERVPVSTVNTQDSGLVIKAMPGMQRMAKEKSNFFITFFKTIAVFVAIIYSLIACFFVGAFELIAQIFGRDGFYTTRSIWNWAWHDVARDWYWVRGVTWHLYFSIALWFALLSGSSK